LKITPLNSLKSFQVQEKLTWQDPEKCRAFFDHFAKRKGFDPLQPENWYTVHLNEMLRSKVSDYSFIYVS